MYNIRAKRCNPGLRLQHVLGIKAAAEICDAEVNGDFVGSNKITFKPKGFVKDKINVRIDTAGSTTLIMQTLLPICTLSGKSFTVTLNGGATAGQWCPTLEYFREILVPNLGLLGIKKPEISVERAGYYPKGGAKIEIRIFSSKPNGIDLTKDFSVNEIKSISEASSFLKNAKVAERQSKAFAKEILSKFEFKMNTEKKYYDTLCPGSAITAFFKTKAGTIVGASSLGELGKPSEKVGMECANYLIKEIEKKALIDKFCADQLMIFMAFTDSSSIKTSEISNHVATNAEIIEKFLPVKFNINKEDGVLSARQIH